MQEPKHRSNLSILLQKSLLIQYANLRSYIALYLSPLIILLTLMLYQYVADHNNQWQKPNPVPYKLDPLPICGGLGCKTLAYAVVGEREPYIDFVMQHVKTVNKLPDDQIEQWDLSPQEIMEHLERYPNRTQNVIIFCTSRWEVQDNFSVPCYADHYHLNFYTIIYNLTLFFKTPYLGNLKDSYPKDLVVMRLKQDIDQALIKFHANSSFELQMQDYPSRSSRFIVGLNVVSQYGSFFFLIPYLILLVLEVSSALKEKEQGLRIGLSTVGVTALQFYLSNIIMSILNNFIITVFFCLFGYILDFKFFSHGVLWFDLATLTCNGILMSLIGLMIVSMVREKKVGMSIAYAFVLYSIVMQWMFTGGFLLFFIYQKTNTRWIRNIKIFFNLYPSFHYSKIFSDVERKADRHFDSFNNKWIEGGEFKYEDLFAVTSGDTSIMNGHYEIPTTIGSFYNLLLTSILYIVLIWYFDHVIESNRGKGAHPLFFLQKKYWCRNKVNNSVGIYQRAEVRNALKCFRKHSCKSSSEDVFALKGASFQIQSNEIVSILGKNGAGKSTMIGVLTGILQLDSGTAHICGMNVDTHMDLIRKRLGVCPQFDILWDDLTAEQHLRMFGELKRVPNLQQQINQSLRQVQMEPNRHGRIKTFSGGMKRRISLAISLLGKPDLIILDEPTTGMDPKVRKLTWNIIRSLKSQASIIITTHNMQEADCLSDRIMVMASGRILAQGSSTALKKQFGSGYTLRIICKDAEQVRNQLLQTGVKCEVEERDLLIKTTKEEELASILEYLQKEKSELISEWLISQSTLEDVFLSVNRRY